ncbi:hypothetical protein CR513_58815, partial [Mucuna pruriens]
MAASLPSFFSVKARGAYLKRSNNIRQGPQLIKVQNYHQDEGRSTNMVDENLYVLKKRIEMVRVRERLERCCTCQHGWNYVPVSNHKTKRDKEEFSLIEFTGLVCGTLALTCFGGTLLIFLVSMLVHLQL